MSDSSANRDVVEQLAEEFVERWRKGEQPSVEGYANAHPQFADRIRRLFPAILLAENMGAPPKSTAIPNSLGEYRIIREIGRGGMGVVYEAVQEPLGRQVALKVLAAAGFADARFRERFQREARAAARLHHTNIVPVYGVGEFDDIHFYAMQFIVGQGLDVLLNNVLRARGHAITRPGTPITPVDGAAAAKNESAKNTPSTSPSLLSESQAEYYRGVARIGLQVATALDYAHGQGVVHRDVKPSNLLMDAAGTVWVTDFGLAKTDDEDGLTHTGDFVGTMRYMAPERFRGESGPSCDVYSLGVTLYEMLTFRPAFDDTDRAKLLDRVLRSEPAPPRSIDKRVPRDLETIVLKAMAKDESHRYPSAQAMADDLHQFLADRPITARRARMTERVWRWCRRNPIPAALLAAVAALLLVILIGSPIMSLKLWEQKQAALDKLWLANLAQAKAQRLTQEAGRRTIAIDSLDAARRLMPSLPADAQRTLDLRNEFFACLTLPDLGPNTAWAGMPPGTAAVTFDAKFERYARGDEKGAVSIRTAAGDKEILRLPELGIGAFGLKFSPDGRYLAVGYHRRYQTNSERFRVWSTETGQQVLAVDSQTGCGEADFSDDSRYVAFGRDNDALAIRDLQDKDAPGQSHKVSSLPSAIAFHPDGDKLAVACRRTVEFRERDSGKVISTRTTDRDVWALAWHPDGHMLATASGSNIVLWVHDNPQPVATLRGHEHLVGMLAFDPRGDVLVSKSNDGSIRLWDVATRQQLVRTPTVFSGCVPLQFSADGRRLAFAADGSRIWTFDVARGHECRLIVPPNAASSLLALSADFSPDGRIVAVCNPDGLRLWNCDTGDLSSFTPIAGGARMVRAAPEGKSIFVAARTEVQRWDLDSDARIARPESLSSGEQVANLVLSRDGATLAIRHRDQSTRLIRKGAETVTLGDHPRLRYITLSPDNKLVATGSEFGSGVRIWDATTGKQLHELPVDSSASVEFTPDGRLLVVGTEKNYTLYDVATWQPRQTLDKVPESTAGDISFSNDGKMMVVRHAPNQLRIYDPATGAELVTLRAPGQQIMSWHRISPDGSRLAAAGAGNVMYLWDLAAIRKQLAERGLDW